MKKLVLLIVTISLCAIPAFADDGGGDAEGLVAHYFMDTPNWGGTWPDTLSAPMVDANTWTFSEYKYSRVEPVVNHLFVNRGWFSVRWVGSVDTSVKEKMEREGDKVSGLINVNPSAASQNMFSMVLADGTTVTRDDLHEGRPDYKGTAKRVVVRPKGNANANSMLVNGVVYELRNGEVYDIQADVITVNLYNDRRSENGAAMGQWWLELSADDAKVFGTGVSERDDGDGDDDDGDTAEYTFEIWADDGCRLLVDGKAVIDDWRPCWEGSPEAVRRSGTIKLKDGKHKMVVEYFQGQSLMADDEDPMQLFWSCSGRGIERQVVPASRFSHSASDKKTVERDKDD